MKIEKRNGGYRVQPMRNGKRYSFTFDHKPSKTDIEEALFDAINEEKKEKGIDITFEDAAKRYNNSKRNVLSPSTISDYDKMTGRFPAWFNEMKIDEMTQESLNRFVNDISSERSPKTVRNYHGYVYSVLGTYRPSFVINTHLPMNIKKEPYIPSDDDIKAILNDVKGKPYECAVYLLCHGLRRSEMLAIDAEKDIEKEVIHINKAMVQDSDKNWIIKNYGKTSASKRDIYVPLWLADKIKEQGFVFQGHPNNVTKYLYSAEKRLGIPRFSAHKMRHYFASKMHELGIPDADIMELGGWETDHVMKAVYRHSLKKENKKENIAKKFQDSIFE